MPHLRRWPGSARQARDSRVSTITRYDLGENDLAPVVLDELGADDLIEAYVDGKVDRVEIVYNAYISPLNQRVTRETLLPLSAAPFSPEEQAPVDPQVPGSGAAPERRAWSSKRSTLSLLLRNRWPLRSGPRSGKRRWRWRLVPHPTLHDRRTWCGQSRRWSRPASVAQRQ